MFYIFFYSYTLCFAISFDVSKGYISISKIIHDFQMMYYCYSSTVARETCDLVNYSNACHKAVSEKQRALTQMSTVSSD